MTFQPIAIVGRSCVLPGALGPAELWEAVRRGSDLLAPCPPGYWRMDGPRPGNGSDAGEAPAWSDRGGRVAGFEGVFDAGGFAVSPDDVLALDPLFHWVLHTAREALRDAGQDGLAAGSDAARGLRTGLILGNLAYPTDSLARLAESTWLDQLGPHFVGGRAREVAGVERPDPRNRFASGLLAPMVARALRLGGGAFALDAACASSLYAIKIASDWLSAGRADLMLAGGANRADNLMLHGGFSTLRALSPSGQSRPFHRRADGLVPAEGAGFVVLKRVDDALRDRDRIFGVIRAVGLSNDGKGRGLLVPSEEGQERAMFEAYRLSGLSPTDVSLVECHATGTTVGDAVEVRSMARVFRGARDVPIGSLKSNLGHLITASGIAALLKVLGAMEHAIRPATLHADEPLEELRHSPFRLLREAEPWTAGGRRVAAISNFGFGGNNAHLVVEEWDGARSTTGRRRPAAKPSPIAVTAMEVLAADGKDGNDFRRDLFGARSRRRPQDGQGEGAFADSIELPLTGLRFPPADLEQTLPQQLFILRAAWQLLAQRPPLPRERTSLWIGMQSDAEVPRYALRLRLAAWARRWAAEEGRVLTPDWLAAARAATWAPLGAAGVVGSMPNIPANRLSSQFDIAGPAFTVAADEASGLVALDLAVEALRRQDCDFTLAGAVDVCCEPVHRAAAAALWSDDRRIPGDAAVVLLLQREEDARREGSPVLAVIDGADGGEPVWRVGPDALRALFGHPHAASGLLAVAAGVLACRHRATPPPSRECPALPWLESKTVEVSIESSDGAVRRVRLRPPPAAAALVMRSAPGPGLYAGADRKDLLRRVSGGDPGGEGGCRLAVLPVSGRSAGEQREEALAALARADCGPGEIAPGVFFRAQPIEGQVALVFTGPAGASHGIASELALAFPDVVAQLGEANPSLAEAAAWAYDPAPANDGPVEPQAKLWAGSFVSQLHYRLLCDVAGLRPQAVIGFSAGESNALFAAGAWTDAQQMYRELAEAGIFSRQLGGQFEVIRRAWGEPGARWTNYRVLAPEEEVRAAIAGQERVHLTIVNAPGDVVIGGEAQACRRVAEQIGGHRASSLGYDLTIHCPELEPYRDEYRRLHRRETHAVPGLRFYSGHRGASYELSSDAVADSLTGLAASRLDFPRLIEAAWRDGVRVFVEVGPRDAASKWIRRILDGRDHVAVATDKPGAASLTQLLETLAQLYVAGLPAGLEPILRRMREADGSRPPRPPSGTRVYPAHPPPIRFPALPPHPPATSASPAAVASVPRAAPGAVHAAVGSRGAVLAADNYARLAGAHREYVELLGHAQRQFLGVQERALAQLRSVGRAAGERRPSPLREARERLPGPSFDRHQLEQLASGRVSAILGPSFADQDGYERQVRLPEPPLLLVDRVLGIAGEPGSMKLGTIWTETEVRRDSWYLNDEGRMPASIVVEAGQADLLLISWLGVDRLNRGQRVYRLLGCELRYTGELPRAGDLLQYEIHIDGHALAGSVRLFFFHYDCRVNGALRLSVRHGQAGFFTDEELRRSGGILWEPERAEVRSDARVDPPHVLSARRRFSRSQVRAFSEGRVLDCFGAGFERAALHTRTPKIQSGQMMLLGEVTHFEPGGGPWKRGYLRVASRVHPDDWYFQGHFKNDPCMPGTLMCEGCLQAMSFFLAAMGYTLDRDGWRFEPVDGQAYELRCRGQVVRESRELVYEVFVEEVVSGPVPRIVADVLGTADGLKIFHGRRLAAQLVPDWPLGSRPQLLEGIDESRREVAVAGGLRLGYASLLACAWGRPSDAFGEPARMFDGPRRMARLPGPPYHFISRVCRLEARMGRLEPGAAVEVEYDVPPDAWYFDENAAHTMPFCVHLEAALQPCGWLAVYGGLPLAAEHDLVFRNLNGTVELLAELPPDAGTLRTRVVLTRVSHLSDMTLLQFDVQCHLRGLCVLRMTTGCGFFTGGALARPGGLPVGEDDGEHLHAPSDFAVDLRGRPARYFAGGLGLPGPMLLALDRVTGCWPAGGPAGLGSLRAERVVGVHDWFFKPHFFQDPVQPGSLGLEAMVQALQFWMLHQGLADGFANPHFEPLALGKPMTWRLRGQITPDRSPTLVGLVVQERGRDERGAWAIGEGSLWVDGLRIYEARGLGMCIVEGSSRTSLPVAGGIEEEIEAEEATPMGLVDRLTRAALAHARANYPARGHEWRLTEVSQVRLGPRPTPHGAPTLRAEVRPLESQADIACVSRLVVEVRLSASGRNARTPDTSLEPAASGRVTVSRSVPAPPPSWPALRGGEEGQLGWSGVFEASGAAPPLGPLDPLLMESALEGLSRRAGHPLGLSCAFVYGPPPAAGPVRCEARVEGFDDDPRPAFRIQLIEGQGRVWLEMLTEDLPGVRCSDV